MNEQQPKKGINILWLLVLAAAVFLIIYLMLPKTAKSEINKASFVEKIGATVTAGEITFKDNANKIYAVYNEGYTFYILYKDDAAKLAVATKNAILADLSKVKDYCSVTIYDQSGMVSQILAEFELYANTKNTDGDQTNDVDIIAWKSSPAQGNLLDIIMPWLYIVAIGVFVFIMWRGLSGRSGLSGMTHNRATVVLNGTTRFTDVAGIEEEKEQVSEIVDFLKHPKKYTEMGARIPKGILLVGQPGTGKTLLAKAIAGEAGVPFFSISGSDFSEMLVGVGPSRMRDLFEQAKANAPAIIFLDEIDSIARMRGVGASGVAEENEQTLNQLLVQMDGFSKSEGVIVLAATNRPDVLDPAILRPGRFDRQIVIQIPDVKGREQILKVHSKNKPMGDADLNRIAKITSGFSGADLENLLNESAIIAAKDNRDKISMADVIEGINKVLMGPQKRSRIITEEDKKITAFHEAGHAVATRILMPEQTVQEVSIIPRGWAAGYTLTNDQDNERNHTSLSVLKNRLAMLLAGRSAETIFIGDICTGASNDIKVATNLADNMVTKWGMSEKLGPLYYGKEDEIALRMYNDKHTSEALQSTIDAEIRLLITNALAQSKKILTDNADKVKIMASVLLARETIYAEDITAIMESDNEAEAMKKIEAHEKIAKEAIQKNKTGAILAKLEPLLIRSMQTAKAFQDANLITEAKLAALQKNFDLAREFACKNLKMPPLPTLDNIEKYSAQLAELSGGGRNGKPAKEDGDAHKDPKKK